MEVIALSIGRLRQHSNARTELTVDRASYGPHGEGAVLDYAMAPSSFGHLLVASTRHGLCWIGIHQTQAYLEAELGRDFAKASITARDGQLKDIGTRIAAAIADPTVLLELPLDIRATPFQLAVWRELCAIPRGTTRSYGEIARKLGRPDASRAVGHANGANPVALIIPCHRVIGSNGTLTGYRWGVGIKQRLLAAEGAIVPPRLSASTLAHADVVN